MALLAAASPTQPDRQSTMCDTLPDVIYDTPAWRCFETNCPTGLQTTRCKSDVLDAVMQVLAASETEADVKHVLAACREHLTPHPSLTLRLLSAMSECSVAGHKCLVIEQLPHFCTSTAAEVSAAISSCRSEYNQQPALRLPIISSLAALHIPLSCQQPLVSYINDALASASPSDYSTLLRSALRCLPLSATLPIIQTIRRLSLTIDCNTAGQLLHTLLEVRAVSGDKVMAWMEAVEGSRAELGVMDVLVLVALLTGGEEEEEDAVWRCVCRCVASRRLTLRRLRDVLCQPWLDILSSYVPALSVLCRRLVSTGDTTLREWARQLLPGVFVSLPASQVEMRRVLLSGCSKSYQAESHSGTPHTATVAQDTNERRFLFNRAELCADIFLRIAHTAPATLVAHLSYLDSVMDFPDALYPLVLHRLAYAIALTIAASPAAASHANRLCNELTKLLTMGNTAGRKTALIAAGHLVRAVSTRCASGVECGWVDGLMRRSVTVLADSVRAVVDAMSGRAAGVSMMHLSGGGKLMSDDVYVLDGEWNVCCVALDSISSVAFHLPTALQESVATTVKTALSDLAVVSYDVPISSPSHPCVLFTHQLPSSLLSHLPEIPSSSAPTSPPVLLVHSFHLSVVQRSNFSLLRLSFLPLLFRSYLICLSSSSAGVSTSMGDVTNDPNPLNAYLQCAYELPAGAASNTLPTGTSLLLDTGLCGVIAYHCCLAAIEVATRSSTSPSLSRPLITAFSTLLHLLDLVVECDKQLKARVQEWKESEHADDASTPSWLSSAHLLHEAVGALPLPDPLLLTIVLQFCLSSPTLPAASTTSSSSTSCSLLRQLYQSAYRPAASPATADLFTDTGFFSLLHISLRSIQLLLRLHRAEPFGSLSSSVFLPAQACVRDSQYAAHAPPPGPLSSSSSSSSYSLSSSAASSSASGFASSSSASSLWPLLPSALSSLVSHCAASGSSVLPAEVLLLRDGCLPVLFASLEPLCSLELDSRKEPYIAPPSATKRAKKCSVAPPTGASQVAPKPIAAVLSGKEEQEEEDELVTPFQRRRRGRRKQLPSTDYQPSIPSDTLMIVEEGPAATVSFALPDQSSQLMVADCLSLLSSHICNLLSIVITHCQDRQTLDERDWPIPWQALVADMARAIQPTSASSSLSTNPSPLQRFFSHLTAVALRHTCSSASLAGWSLARALHSLDGSLSLPPRILQQLLSVYPHNQLLATSVALHLLPLPTVPATSSPASLFMSNLSIRSPQLLKLFDATARAFVAHCARHVTQPAPAGREDGWIELTTPLQSSKLTGGLHGDDWTLHWLSWQYCETADASHVEPVVEWILSSMYELMSDEREMEEDEGDHGQHNVALTGHPVLATLTAGSFASYLQLLLLLTEMQLAKLQPPTARPTADSFVNRFHRAVLVYCHLLQVHLLAANISLPSQRLHISSSQPSSFTEPSVKHSKRSRSSSPHSQCRPLCPSDPSCNLSSAILSATHSAVVSSFVFISRVIRLHLPAAVSSEVQSTTNSALHSTELLNCINLCLYASEQAEVINMHAPVVATPARVGRKRKSGTAADTASDPSSTSLQLLKSVELLRATIDALMTPYGYTLQTSHEPTANNGQAVADSSHSPLPPLPQHTISELTDTPRSTPGAVGGGEHERAHNHDDGEEEEGEEEEEEEEENWSEEDDDSGGPPAAGLKHSISRFHQRMDDPKTHAKQQANGSNKKSSHNRRSRHRLFDSTDDDEEDEEYAAEEEGGGDVAEGDVGDEKKEEEEQRASLARVHMAEDDDIESGKDEADDEGVRQG